MAADVCSAHLLSSDRLKTLKLGGSKSKGDREREGGGREEERGREG